MAGINPVIDPLQRKLVCGPEEGQNTTVDGFQVNVIGDTGSGLYNAGDGIDIEGSTINVALTAGYRGAVSGSTVGFDPTGDIVTVTGASVTLQPDTAYKIYATTSAVTLNANVLAAGKWAYDGHIEMFVAGTGYVQAGANVVLANALEPDSVNNCTVRFHDGIAIISVEDHVAGYIVVNGATSGDGSLYYGISTSTNDYVAFDASLNGTTIPLAGAVAEGEKHIVGNGYAETTLTGAVDCGTSKFTVANLSLQNVTVNGGVMTLGDSFIPSGSTVAVSGGGLAIEKVTGAGESSVIDLRNKNIVFSGSVSGSAVGVTFSGGSAQVGGAMRARNGAKVFLTDCVFTGNITSGGADGGTLHAQNNGTVVTLTGCTFSGNKAYAAGGVSIVSGGSGVLSNCLVTANTVADGNTEGVQCFGSSFIEIIDTTIVGSPNRDFIQGYGSATISASTVGICTVDGGTIGFAGINTVDSIAEGSIAGHVVISSGAVLDLTGNSNPTPIAPGGGITFESGGATVLYSSGAVSGSYMMDNVALPAGAKLTNTNVIDYNGSLQDFKLTPGALMDGLVLTNAAPQSGSGTGAYSFTGNSAQTDESITIRNCIFTGNNTTYGLVWVRGSINSDRTGKRIINLTGCTFSNNSGTSEAILANSNGIAIISGCAFDNVNKISTTAGGIVTFAGSNAIPTKVDGSGSAVIGSGAVIDLTGNTNATPIAPGGGVIVDGGGCTVITSAGASVSIAGGTYTQINNDGTTE